MAPSKTDNNKTWFEKNATELGVRGTWEKGAVKSSDTKTATGVNITPKSGSNPLASTTLTGTYTSAIDANTTKTY